MSLITVSTVKGAPGGTSVALLLAASMAQRLTGACPSAAGCLLAECDSWGGDLGPRLGLPAVPGLASLALAARHGLHAALIKEHAQPIPQLPGVSVLLGIAGPDQALALGWMIEPLAQALAQFDRCCVADLGRFAPGSEGNHGYRRHACLNLLVTSDQLASLLHARSAVESAAAEQIPLRIVVTGERTHTLAKLARITGAPVLGAIRLDSRIAAPSRGRLGVSRLRRGQAGTIGAELADAVERALAEVHRDPEESAG